MMRIGKTQLTAISLALVFTASLMAGGCASKSAQSEMSLTERAEQAATRAENAASRAEAAATRADTSANDAALMAEKTERIFDKKMKK